MKVIVRKTTKATFSETKRLIPVDFLAVYINGTRIGFVELGDFIRKTYADLSTRKNSIAGGTREGALDWIADGEASRIKMWTRISKSETAEVHSYFYNAERR